MPDAKPELNWDKVKKFSAQVSNDIGAAMLGAMSYIGDRLGIFKSLADGASVSSVELAAKTGLDERYLREWLGAMTAAELASAAKPLMGCSFTILWPSVLIIRQPPTAVPEAMVQAHSTFIQSAISRPLPCCSVRRKDSEGGKWSNCPVLVAPNNVSAMMPIVFWASLVPCMNPMAAALNICATPKKRFTRCGRRFCNAR